LESKIRELVEQLQLVEHPEGGWYRETYRTPFELKTDRGTRNLATLIYYLLPAGIASRVHRVAWDEIWIFQDGGALELMTHDQGKVTGSFLGLGKGETPQIRIPAGMWFNARVAEGEYVLASCLVSPGFDFADLEMVEDIGAS
jgi:uncharacterized protein